METIFLNSLIFRYIKRKIINYIESLKLYTYFSNYLIEIIKKNNSNKVNERNNDGT